MSTTTPPPAGWHPDPHKPGQDRYWDGKAWAETWRDSARSPAAVKRKRGGSTVLKVMLGVVLGGTLLIVGCAALVAGGLNSTNDKGITRADFDHIAQGTTRTAVEAKLGAPENAQDFEQQIPDLQNQPHRSSCIYYQEKGKKILEGSSFQLCFDDGKLTSKNAY